MKRKLYQTPLTNIQQKNSQINKLELRDGKTVLKSFPRRIVFELTNRCNFRCIMCGREASTFKTYDLPMSVIRSFEPCFPYVEEVALHGWGEGTLHPDFIEILKLLNNYNLLRKYFVTNASTLSEVHHAIFDYHVDVLAVSMDGAATTTNDFIRKGGSLECQTNELRKLIEEKLQRNLDYPHINLVFTAMRRNIRELPDMITLARDLGIREVKVVYFTVFKADLQHESLFNRQKEVSEVFTKFNELAERFNIKLKLPEIQGKSKAGTMRHKRCPFPWRDIFVGSDGFVRPCQSSPQKLSNVKQYKDIEELWNAKKIRDLRQSVNNESLMPEQCHVCYHSSCANWNLRDSFYQLDHGFAPEWKDNKMEKTLEA
ncbi:MAG: radical SAM protein [Candidatus Brocadiaceae bacterium]|nr:radical SAM protein [Candidatus Brocadiaceae bacterium]